MSFQEPQNLNEFQALIQNNDLVVVDFHAVWCAPCKIIAPTLKKLAESTPQVVFAKVDVDEVGDVAADQEIRAMPTIRYFKGGQPFGEVVGANLHQITATLQNLLNEP